MTLCQRDDFTPTKQAPEDNTKSTDHPNDVVETKQGLANVAEYIIRDEKLVDSDLSLGNHSKTVWYRDGYWSWS